MSDCGCGLEQSAMLERKTLRALIAINAAMFLVEAIAGWLGQSTGLIADSLDMLADASVYGISLYAVGRSHRMQAAAGTASGFLQILLVLGVLADVVRRFYFGSEPASGLMMSVGTLALAANVTCLLLLAKHRDGGIHMRASWIFSTNDVIANVSVVISGVLVAVLGSRMPDLIVGTLVAILVVRGGLRIIRESRESRSAERKKLASRDA